MFAKRLKELRKERGLTQQELASILGVKQYIISNAENLNHKVSYDLLIKMADYFGVTVDYLIGRTDIRTTIDNEIHLKEQELKELNFKVTQMYAKIQKAKVFLDMVEKTLCDERGEEK